jgi:hypothetical protein
VIEADDHNTGKNILKKFGQLALADTPYGVSASKTS